MDAAGVRELARDADLRRSDRLPDWSGVTSSGTAWPETVVKSLFQEFARAGLAIAGPPASARAPPATRERISSRSGVGRLARASRRGFLRGFLRRTWSASPRFLQTNEYKAAGRPAGESRTRGGTPSRTQASGGSGRGRRPGGPASTPRNFATTAPALPRGSSRRARPGSPPRSRRGNPPSPAAPAYLRTKIAVERPVRKVLPGSVAAGGRRDHVPEPRPMGVPAAETGPLHAHAPVGVLDRDVVDGIPETGGEHRLAADQHQGAVDVVDLAVAIVLPAIELPHPPLPGDRLAEAELPAGRPEAVAVAEEVVALRSGAADASDPAATAATSSRSRSGATSMSLFIGIR